MNRTTAIVVTAATALLCGCPGLALATLGVMAAMGSQMPEVMAQDPNNPQDVLLGSGMFLCIGGLLILIPVIAGILSMRYAKSSKPGINEPLPPGS